MRRLVTLGVLLVLTLTAVSPGAVSAAAGPRTYTVIVGAEDVSRGIDVMAYFPDTVRLHVGDTLHFAQGSHEIHSVTFLANGAEPPLIEPAPQPNPLNSPLQIAPEAAFPVPPAGGPYDGATYANSGIMSTDPGQPTSFDLTFTKAGTYDYYCLIHGHVMSGRVIVVDASTWIASPHAVAELAKRQMAQAMRQAPAVIEAAQDTVLPPTHNANGTTTYHARVGFSSTVMVGSTPREIDLLRFFPGKLVVHPGDTVDWTLNAPPHSISFLNGNADIPFIVPVPQPAGPPLILLNPAALGPINPGQALDKQNVFSSGIIGFAPPPFPTFSQSIGQVTGQIPYICLLHDTSGMKASLIVVPNGHND
jgi:plastocyanin